MTTDSQRTIAQSVSIHGAGVHSGKIVRLRLLPAPEDCGVIFRRVDLTPVVEIPARADYVVDTRSCTCLGVGEARVATIEHLMAVLSAFAIDNIYIEVDAAELPILDGSAKHYVELIQQAGIYPQAAAKKTIQITEPIEVVDGDKKACLQRFNGFQLNCEIVYQHPCFNADNQRFCYDFSLQSFIDEIAPARTFGFYADYEFYKKNNLARGASLGNTVVFDDRQVMNKNGLRFADEMVRHKCLDVIGDLYTCGYSLLGSFVGFKTRHGLNHLLVKKLLEYKALKII